MPFLSELEGPEIPGSDLPAPRPPMGEGIRPEPEAPSLGQTYVDTFGRTNPIGSAIEGVEALQGRTFVRDPAYGGEQVLDTIGRGSKYDLYYRDNFVGDREPAETRWRMSRIDKDEERRKRIDASGWTGTLLEIASGAASPSNFIPGMAIVRGVRGGVSALRSGVASGALMGGAMAADELVLQGTQETRTWEESAFAIGGGAVLGSVLGGTVAALRGRSTARLERDLTRHLAKVFDEGDAIARGEAPIGAGRSESTLGAEANTSALVTPDPAFGATRAASFLGGPQRQMNARGVDHFDTSHLFAQKMTTAGYHHFVEGADGVVGQVGGTVEDNMKRWDGPLSQAVDAFYDNYARYYWGKEDVGALDRAGATIGSVWARVSHPQGGKMTREQFFAEATRAARRGDEHPIPEVARAAKAYRKLDDELLEAGIEVGHFDAAIKEKGVRGAKSHLMRVYDPNRMSAHRYQPITDERGTRPGFVPRVINWLKMGQDRAAREAGDLRTQVDQVKAELDKARGDLATNVGGFFEKHKANTAARKQLAAETREKEAALKDKTKAHAKQERADQREHDKHYERLLRHLKRGRGDENPADIVRLVKEAGGVRLDILDAMDRVTKQAAGGGEIRDLTGGRLSILRQRGIVNQKGMLPERMAELAIDKGYLQPGASIDDLVRALDETLNRGRPVYSEFDADAVAYNAALRELLQDLERAGFDLNAGDVKLLEEIMRDGQTGAPLSAAAQKLLKEIEDAAKAFDAVAAPLDELDRLLRVARDLAPDMAEKGKELRQAARESMEKLRPLERQVKALDDFIRLGDGELDAIANEAADKILSLTHFRTPGIDIVQGPRGALLERSINMPDEMLEDFLDNNIARVAEIQTRSMAADIELARVFDGDVTAREMFEKLRDEFHAKKRAATSPSEEARIEKSYKTAVNDMEAMRDRVRNTYMMPADVSAMPYRLGKLAQNFNVPRLLGSAVIPAITDVGKVVQYAGLTGTFSDGFAPLTKNFSTYRMAIDEAKAMGIGTELSSGLRSKLLTDVFTDHFQGTKFERAVEWMGPKALVISLLTPWTTAIKQFLAPIVMNRVLNAVRAVAEGTATRDQVGRLSASGINEDLARRIWAQFAGEPGGPPPVKGGPVLDDPETLADDMGQGQAARAPGLSDPMAQAATDSVLARFRQPGATGAQPSAKPATVADIEQAVVRGFGPAARDLTRLEVIKVVQSVDELPARLDGEAHPGDVKGMFDGERAYLVADNLRAGEAKGVVLHEIGVHYGMRTMLGDDLYEKVLAGVAKRQDVMKLVPEDTPKQWVREEALAYLVETAPDAPLVKQMLAQVRQFIYRLTGGHLIDLTDDDLRAMAVSALRRVAKTESGNVRYSRGAQAKSLSDVEALADRLGVKHAISESKSEITLSKIVAAERGQGAGTQVMDALAAYADASGKRIVLSPSADFGGSVSRLREFYKRFGFVENKGKNKDFSTREAMYREPRYSRAKLPMDEASRMARAKEQGFDTETTWYHATPYNFDKFVPSSWRGASYFAAEPEGAMRGMAAGGGEHPALSGPTVGGAERGGASIVPALVRGKIWGKDPMPLEWFSENITYGEYKDIIAGKSPIKVEGLSEAQNAELNGLRQKQMSLVYDEAVPASEFQKYTGDNEDALPLKRARDPVADPMGWEGVEGGPGSMSGGAERREMLQKIGYPNWLVWDEGGSKASLAVSDPKNVRSRFAEFDPEKIDSDNLLYSRQAGDEGQVGHGFGQVRDGIYLPNTSMWTDREARRAFSAAIVRDVDNAIVTPGLERPNWISHPVGKVVGQFKGFGLSSIQKTLISGLQQRDAAVLNGWLVMMATGALAAKLKADLRGEDTGRWTTGKWAAEAIDHSGIIGALTDVNDAIEKASGGKLGMAMMSGMPATRYMNRSLGSTFFGPSFGLLENVWQVAGVGGKKSGWSAADTHAAREAFLPLQNFWLIRTLLDDAEDGFNEAMGVAPRKLRQ
jgi:GNAT superfamily N-acetyltransferase